MPVRATVSGGAEDGPAEAAPGQRRQIARVVEVGMREDDSVEIDGMGRERLPVAGPKGAAALVQPAVHEEPPGVVVDEEPAARDGPGTAEELDVHGHDGDSSMRRPLAITGARWSTPAWCSTALSGEPGATATTT